MTLKEAIDYLSTKGTQTEVVEYRYLIENIDGSYMIVTEEALIAYATTLKFNEITNSTS